MKPTTTLTLDAANAHSEVGFPAGKLTGLIIVALLPALFWTAVLALATNAAGFAMSSATMIVIASAIALFLTAIYAAMTTGSDHA